MGFIIQVLMSGIAGAMMGEGFQEMQPVKFILGVFLLIASIYVGVKL